MVYSQADEKAYVMSSNVEDVEMQDVEDESDEEDAVEDELGNHTRCKFPMFHNLTFLQTKVRTKKNQKNTQMKMLNPSHSGKGSATHS